MRERVAKFGRDGAESQTGGNNGRRRNTKPRSLKTMENANYPLEWETNRIVKALPVLEIG